MDGFGRNQLVAGQGTPSGVYGLDTERHTNSNTSFITIQRNGAVANKQDIVEAIEFMKNAKDESGRGTQDNLMGNVVPRQQCTLGTVKYKNYMLMRDPSKWPKLAKIVLEHARESAKFFTIVFFKSRKNNFRWKRVFGPWWSPI